MPDLSTLPLWAQFVIYAVFGFGLLVVLIVGRGGLLSGIKGSAADSAQAQVAAVIVDPAALNRATAAIEAMNMTMVQANTIAKAGGKVDAGQADATADLAREVAELRGAISDLRDEVIRGAARMK